MNSSEKKQYAVRGIDPKRSFLDTIKSYPKNLEIRHTLTFKSSKPPRNNLTNTISFQINHSLILLPDKPMSLRYADDRIGWLNIKKYDYNNQFKIILSFVLLSNSSFIEYKIISRLVISNN